MFNSICPACGDFIDYCLGHGPIGDPDGHAILAAHDAGEHNECHVRSDCHDPRYRETVTIHLAPIENPIERD